MLVRTLQVWLWQVTQHEESLNVMVTSRYQKTSKEVLKGTNSQGEIIPPSLHSVFAAVASYGSTDVLKTVPELVSLAVLYVGVSVCVRVCRNTVR